MASPIVLSFFALGDWGYYCNETIACAKSMSEFARQRRKSCGQTAVPKFVIALGDNFYDCGVLSVNDAQWEKSWAKPYLRPYKALRVPWKAVLGNHDYEGRPQAQIDFSTYEKNPFGGLWQMYGDDGVPSRRYTFTYPAFAEHPLIYFVAYDSNAVQYSARRRYPELMDHQVEDVAWLKERVFTDPAYRNATFRVVFAHHPMYTRGNAHGVLGDCLRNETYQDRVGATHKGFNMEPLFVGNGVDVYLTGHEHVPQHAYRHGIHHIVAGSTLGNVWYKGADPKRTCDWEGDRATFVTADVAFPETASPGAGDGMAQHQQQPAPATAAQLSFQYRDITDGALLHEVILRKPLSAEAVAATMTATEVVAATMTATDKPLSAEVVAATMTATASSTAAAGLQEIVAPAAGVDQLESARQDDDKEAS